MGAELRKLPNGDVELGGEIDGVFIRFHTLSAGKVSQLRQRAAMLAERAAEGDALAQDQIGKPIGPSAPASGVTTKSTVDELDAYAAEHGIADYPTSGTKADKLAAIAAYHGYGEED